MKLINERSWREDHGTFDNNLMVLNEADGILLPFEMNFDFTPFWVRVNNIPLAKINAHAARAIGNALGECLDFEDDDPLALAWGFKVRVNIDVRRPLRRAVKLAISRTESKKLPLQYERLPLLCYACGRMGHTQKECSFIEKEGSKDTHSGFGP